MINSILNLKGVKVLSRNEQKNVNGGQKCVTLEVLEGVSYENDGPGTGTYNGGVVSANTCIIQCRPSFLGIGFGSWSEPERMPC